jgi:hypothetical protein
LTEYCREIEDHLTRVNGGHLVRIVGVGFETVRQWADAGIPLSVVLRGIELKADRHRLGSSTRPLRIEFCDADVRDLFREWRRAVGIPRETTADGSDTPDAAAEKRPSLPKHLDRAIDRLSRVAGRLELPEPLLAEVAAMLQDLTALRESAKGARGAAKETAMQQLGPLDERLMAAARTAASADLWARFEAQASEDLRAYRDRLAGEAWQRAVATTAVRLARDHFGLPTLTL